MEELLKTLIELQTENNNQNKLILKQLGANKEAIEKASNAAAHREFAKRQAANGDPAFKDHRNYNGH